ncbi:VOC family protein [Epidermidibacterium keratini]|uniref:VOC family protein n=1 Tax=Epidermidibacterium keratini TaxID=1891644 RepID=A0A7L4YS61_9ACTN|nr:VOC family protein [Epidermidibacterium keratini]QHC02006.1 VOC family protein [Epidermidibacterium keratini]
MPRIKFTSVYVDDQERALQFYTRRLGFALKADDHIGESRWLSVVSDEDRGGPELLLEPTANMVRRRLQDSLYSQRIPAMTLEVDDLEYEYDRLVDLGVTFTAAPHKDGPHRSAVLDDTCGNWIRLVEE